MLVHDVVRQAFGAKLSPLDDHKLTACAQDEIAVLGTQVNFLALHIVGSYFYNVQVYCKNGSEQWVPLERWKKT